MRFTFLTLQSFVTLFLTQFFDDLCNDRLQWQASVGAPNEKSANLTEETNAHPGCLGLRFAAREVNSLASEQELHVLLRQVLNGGVIGVDSAANHSRLLFLQQNHARLDGVFNDEALNGAIAVLSDAVAAVGRLPLSSRVPPTVNR
jgi:hypothetical protein